MPWQLRIEIRVLHSEGLSVPAISGKLGLDRRAVASFVKWGIEASEGRERAARWKSGKGQGMIVDIHKVVIPRRVDCLLVSIADRQILAGVARARTGEEPD